MDAEKKKALIKDFLDGLKSEGMSVAEDQVAMLVKRVFSFGEAYIIATDSKTDDIALPFLPMAERVLLGLVDKIDGQDDEGR